VQLLVLPHIWRMQNLIVLVLHLKHPHVMLIALPGIDSDQ
jgi:hypothetical protein